MWVRSVRPPPLSLALPPPHPPRGQPRGGRPLVVPRARGALRPSALPGVTWPVRWQGKTPLIKAADKGHTGIAVTLIDHKADVNSADISVSLARPACREPLGAWRWCRVEGAVKERGLGPALYHPADLRRMALYMFGMLRGGAPPQPPRPRD